MEALPVDLYEKICMLAFSHCMPLNSYMRLFWKPYLIKHCINVVNDAPKSRKEVEKQLRVKSGTQAPAGRTTLAWDRGVDAKHVHSLIKTAKSLFVLIVLKQQNILEFEHAYRVCYDLCLLNAAGQLHFLMCKFLGVLFNYHENDPEYMLSAFKVIEDITLHLNRVCKVNNWLTARQAIDKYVAQMES